MKPKLYHQIADTIREQIRSGQFKARALLPPERVLVDQLSVSRTTLRNALRELRNAGVVKSLDGVGWMAMPGGEDDGTSDRMKKTAVVAGHRSLSPYIHEALRRNLETPYQIFLCDPDGHFQDRENLLQNPAVSGILLIHAHAAGESIMAMATQHNKPLVSLQRYNPLSRHNVVCSDRMAGSVQAVDLLYEHGHRSVLYVSAMVAMKDPLSMYAVCREAFKQRCQQRGMRFEELHSQYNSWSHLQDRLKLIDWLNTHRDVPGAPTAIYQEITNELVLFRSIVEEAGWPVPERCSMYMHTEQEKLEGNPQQQIPPFSGQTDDWGGIIRAAARELRRAEHDPRPRTTLIPVMRVDGETLTCKKEGDEV